MAENVFMNAQAQYDLNNINDIIGSMGGEKDFADRSEISDIGMRGSVTEATSVFTNMESEIEIKKKPYVQIIEQPQPKALRFRYSCEGRSAGSIPGVSSTSENKTYPTIKIMNYKGSAVVVVSLVTIDKPYRPHPHKLVGKEGCKNGVCTVTIDNDAMEYVFSNLGIQCVKKKEVEEALQHREEIRVDPFSTGFQHRKHPQNLDLNAARLCFQVFLNNKKEGRFTIPLKPVVSDSIFDKKATCDLNICKLSDCSSCVSGGKEIILLCDKVAKEDVQVRFFEVRDGREVWEGFGDFQASDVHKQVAIAFKTPKYKDLQVMETVRVFIQLVRPSDRSASDPRPFDFLPMDAGTPFSSLKRLKNRYGLFNRILGLDSQADAALPHKEPVRSTQITEISLDTQPPKSPKAVFATPAPTVNSNTPSVDDIRRRMEASLAGVTPERFPQAPIIKPTMSSPPQPLWVDSDYDDATLLSEVLSEGSVNDLLSAAGDAAVYEDVMMPGDCLDATPLYGDISYASCFSDLIGSTTQGNSVAPVLPPKQGNAFQNEDTGDDFAIYGTPCGRPVHANKESLLRTRGFMSMPPTTSASRDPTVGGNAALATLEDDLLYSPPVSDIQEEEEESLVADVPQTILDLFV